MGLFGRLLGIEERMHRRATEGVDMVKVGLAMYLLPECKAIFDAAYATRLTAAVVNTVFSEDPSNEEGRQFVEDEGNRKRVALVIDRTIRSEEKLVRIITEAVRVQCAQSWRVLKAEPGFRDPDRLSIRESQDTITRLILRKASTQEPLVKLRRLGLLHRDGQAPESYEMPDLGLFLHNAGGFVVACKTDFDLNRAAEE